MITGELRSKIDRLWDSFWSGGISNPLEVIEQITYLMFIRRLEDLQTLKEKKANRTGKPIEDPIYDPETNALRWSAFTETSPGEMFQIVSEAVFPWLRRLGGDDSTYSQHMKDARFTIPTPNLLTKAVDALDELPLDQGDVKGDLYEYMLSKIATAGQNGQFRTPRHIIQLMVEMMNPGPRDEICDPACGTAGFLVAAAEYVQREHDAELLETAQQRHFHNSMFHGFDFDGTMLRIASMNMLLHGIDQPDIRYCDSLAESAAGEAERYSLILANPPFAGSLDYETTAKDLQQIVKTKKTELLFPALFLRLLKPGGRAAVIVPDGVLFGSTKAHVALRQILVEDQKLDAIVKLPSGVFKPYAGVSTAIVFFTKTDAGGTDNVWFYEVTADGYSLDDKRTPLLPETKLGARPSVELDDADHAKNNLPDVLARWSRRDGSESERVRTEQSFCVPKADIVAQSYDLSLNRYKEVVHEEIEHRPPLDVIADLERLESEIQAGLSDLKGKARMSASALRPPRYGNRCSASPRICWTRQPSITPSSAGTPTSSPRSPVTRGGKMSRCRCSSTCGESSAASYDSSPSYAAASSTPTSKTNSANSLLPSSKASTSEPTTASSNAKSATTCAVTRTTSSCRNSCVDGRSPAPTWRNSNTPSSTLDSASKSTSIWPPRSTTASGCSSARSPDSSERPPRPPSTTSRPARRSPRPGTTSSS